MKPASQENTLKDDPLGDRLVPVLQRIARRADELFGQGGRNRGSDLEYWLQAEREVFEQKDMRLESCLK
jgi:hypothetical protein